MINLFKFIIGTIFGSFITLLSIRPARHESIVFPPSHCDTCHHQLKPWELIPVISFILLRGHCQKCHRAIGISTFIGELSGGIIVLSNSLSIHGAFETLFELLLLFISECDYRRYLIPVSSLILLLLITLLERFIMHQLNLYIIIPTFFVYIFTLWINHYFKFIGNGDIDLIFLLFLKTNFTFIILIIVLSSLFAILKYSFSHSTRFIPYVPYLAVTYFLILL